MLRQNIRLLKVKLQGLVHKAPYRANLDAVEVLLVSYPRSGQTWLRCMLADYLHGGVDFSNVNEYIPGVGDELWTKKTFKHLIIGTHSVPGITKRLKDTKIIYINRNRDDILKSYQKAFNRRYNVNLSMVEFDKWMEKWYSFPMAHRRFRSEWLATRPYVISYPFTTYTVGQLIYYLTRSIDRGKLSRIYKKFSKENMIKMGIEPKHHYRGN